MMKKTYMMVALGICILLLIPMASAAETKEIDDETNDVMDYNNQTIDSPNIDIKKLTYYQDGSTVTFTLQVVGKVDDKSIYEIALETDAGDSDDSTTNQYEIFYTKNPVYSKEMDIDTGGVVYDKDLNQIPSDFSIPSSGTLRASFNLKNQNEKITTIFGLTTIIDETQLLFGFDTLTYEAENNTSNNTSQNNNNTTPTDNNQTNQNTSNGSQQNGNSGGKQNTPGFETIMLLLAVAATVLVIKRRR